MAIVGQGIAAYPIPNDALNENSKNPVQNKVIAGNIKELKNNNATQDERITGLGQATTATTIGPASIATFEAPTANMPLKGLTANIGPVQSGSGDPSPDNVRPITGLTRCKLHHTGVSLIGGDAFIGNTFSKTATGYQLSYNGSSIANRASAWADIRGLPAGRYRIAILNPSYPEGAEVNIRRSTAGNTVTMGIIIGSDAYGVRTYNIPENTTSIQLYIIPGTMPLNNSITMDDIVLVREDVEPEPYKGNIYNISFPSEAGAVYGGTLDALTGLLTVKWFGLCFDTAEKIEAMGSFTDNRMQIRTSDIPYPRIKNSLSQLCSHAKYQSNAGAIHQDTRTEAQFQIYPSDNRVFFEIPGVDSLQGYKDFATEQMNTGTPLTFVSLVNQSKYMTYQLSPIEVATLLGENNIWANRGDVTVTYGVYLETVKELVDKREVREEQVEGTVVNLNAEPNTRYICGEVATLDITLPVSGICDIVFTSGSTPTVLTVSSTVKWMHGFDPTALAADTIYELNFMDGLGVVVSWT